MKKRQREIEETTSSLDEDPSTQRLHGQLIRFIRPDESTDMESFMFRLSADSNADRPILAIDREWFVSVSDWASSTYECNEWSQVGVRPIPTSCSEYCCVIVMGLLAAAHGDIGFLPSILDDGTIDIHDAAFTVNTPTTGVSHYIGLFRERHILNFGPVVDYFMLKPMIMRQCYVHTLPRILAERKRMMVAALLYAMPKAAIDTDLLSVMHAPEIVDYLFLHPSIDTHFLDVNVLNQTQLLGLSWSFLKSHRELKNIPSLSELAMRLLPVMKTCS